MAICIYNSLSRAVRLSRVEDEDFDRRTVFREIREYASRQLMISITVDVRVVICRQRTIGDTQCTKAAQPCQSSLFKVIDPVTNRF